MRIHVAQQEIQIRFLLNCKTGLDSHFYIYTYKYINVHIYIYLFICLNLILLFYLTCIHLFICLFIYFTFFFGNQKRSKWQCSCFNFDLYIWYFLSLFILICTYIDLLTISKYLPPTEYTLDSVSSCLLRPGRLDLSIYSLLSVTTRKKLKVQDKADLV